MLQKKNTTQALYDKILLKVYKLLRHIYLDRSTTILQFHNLIVQFNKSD